MRIDNYSIHQITRTQSAPGAEKSRDAVPEVRHDSVQLSSTGRLFMAARKALRSLPPVRYEKTQAVSDLLAADRYQMNGEAIAAAMLDDTHTERSDS